MTPPPSPPRLSANGAIALIVIAELFGTSLWFVGPAIAPELVAAWGLSASGRAALLTATQLGFILGTFVLAMTGIADRLPAHRLFALSALGGAAFNLALLFCESLQPALLCRLGVGLALAGIYPLGMKLVVSWAPTSARVALSWLVGALTLGTAIPYGLRASGWSLDWQRIVELASALAVLAALVIGQVGSGPHTTLSPKLGWSSVRCAFAQPHYRASAFAYFGHMWELYAFWGVVPLLVQSTAAWPADALFEGAFWVVAMGALGCVAGGWLARGWTRRSPNSRGSAWVAAGSLAISAACALLFPLVQGATAWLVLLVWGTVVVADSPQFSALSAAACPPDTVGSGLTIQNSIGFAISIVSIQCLALAWPLWGAEAVWLLVPGPLLGLWALRILVRGEKCEPQLDR